MQCTIVISSLTRLVDSVHMVLVSHTTYWVAVTHFGDYLSIRVLPWSLPVSALSATVLGVSVQHFYAYRIYLLSRGSPYLPVAISTISLTAFCFGIVLGVKGLEHRDWQSSSLRNIFVAIISCNLLCDALITFGMVYTLLRNRTLVARTNTVLNLLAIYAINCSALYLVFGISGAILRAKYRETLIYTSTTFIAIRLYFCSFMAVLNSRNSLRETLDGPELVVVTFTQLEAHPPPSTTVPRRVQVKTETRTNMVFSESPVQVPSYASSSDSLSVMALDREKYTVPPVPAVLTG